MAAKTAAARERLYRRGATADRFAADTAVGMAIAAIRVLGAHGYVSEPAAGRSLRDAAQALAAVSPAS
jgi:alkylation response protein AidB-like acyl-CoA dehydrogenase